MTTHAAYIELDEGAAPATPAAGRVRVYAKADGSTYQKDDAGLETGLAGGSSGGTYAAWTPTLTADGGNPNIGSTGTATGRYTQIGKLVHAYGRIVFAGAGISGGTGEWEIALPVAASSNAFPGNSTIYGTAILYDDSTATFQLAAVYALDAGECRIALNKVGAPLTAQGTAPWTWAASDQLILELTYEAA